VIGLRWKHLSDDCSTAWIGESFVRGDRKATKTNRDRTIALTPRLQKMILERIPENFVADDFVFKTPNGKPIDDNNFRNRAWTRILTKNQE
jgi:integrase